MPRVSKDTRQKILSTARKQLLQHPDDPVSMRKIAALCGISAGTIYNHFPDKDSLMAAVMIEDWHQALASMERKCRRAESFTKGVAGIYRSLCDFIRIYRNVWMDYRVSGKYAAVQSRRHRQLIDEIAAYIRTLLERFAQEKDLNMDRILAENILTAALQQEISLETLLQLASYIAD